MADLPINDLNVASNETLITPDQLKRDIPLSDTALRTVTKGREVIRNILDGTDHRLFIVIGPCSIHDIKAAHEYAERLKALAAEVSDTLYLVMRVYFEKPRTTVGWERPDQRPLPGRLVQDPGRPAHWSPIAAGPG